MYKNSTGEISNWKLALSLWMTRHKVLFFRLQIGLYVFFILFFYGFTVWKLVELFVVKRTERAQIIQSLLENPISYSSRETMPLEPIQVQFINTIPSTGGRVDIVAGVYNPNEKYAAQRVEYEFVSGGKIIASDISYIWPKEKKYFTALGVASGDASLEIELVFKDISWALYQDFEALLDKRMKFIITDTEFRHSRTLDVNSAAAGIVSFSVTNSTLFNFYDPGFYILIYQNDDIAAITFTRLYALKSLEKADISVNIFSPVGFVTRIEVLPELNILDENIYFTEEVEGGELK